MLLSELTILTDNMVGAGVHINGVGGECPDKTELHRESRHLAPDHPVNELWQVITGAAKGRQGERAA